MSSASCRIAATALNGWSGSLAAASALTSSPVRWARAAARAVAAVHPPVARSSRATSAGPMSSPNPARHSCSVSSGRSARSAGGQLDAVRPAQPRGAVRKAPGEHDEVLVGLQVLGEALDQQARAAAGVVGVVHDERAAFAGQRAEQGIDRAGGVLARLRHGRGGAVKPAWAAAVRSRAAKSWAGMPPSCSTTSIATDRHMSASSVPSTVLPYPAAASITTTPACRQVRSAVDAGRGAGADGPMGSLSQPPAAGPPGGCCQSVKSAIRRKYPACDVHVTPYTESCRMSRPWLAGGEGGNGSTGHLGYPGGRPG